EGFTSSLTSTIPGLCQPGRGSCPPPRLESVTRRMWMIGRRFLAAGIVAGAVAVGGVAGALIGIPGLSSASRSSTTSDATGASGATGTTGPDGGRHFHGFFGLHVGADKGVIDAAAQALHLTTEQLLDKLSDGKTTIADVAEQQHVDLQTVTDAMEAVA